MPAEWELPFLSAFGALLRERRLALGLSKRELARRTFTSRSVLQRFEAGQVRPRRSMLVRLAAALAGVVVERGASLDEAALVEEWVAAVGPALAAERADGRWSSARASRRRDVERVRRLLAPERVGLPVPRAGGRRSAERVEMFAIIDAAAACLRG